MKTIDRKTIIIAAAALVLAACSSDDGSRGGDSSLQPEIQFIPVVGGSTRALQTGSDISMLTGDKFYVWADQRNEEGDEGSETYSRAVFFNEWELAVQAGVNRIAASRETKRYPAMNRVQFYALHGNFSGTSSSFNPADDVLSSFPISFYMYNERTTNGLALGTDELGPLLHSVETDQSTTSGYTKSDLLYAVVPEMSASNAAIPLAFHHMLSKVVVNLMLGKGLTTAELSTATVKIKNVKTKMLFAPKKLKFLDGLVDTDTYEEAWMMEEATELDELSVRESMLQAPDTDNPATATILLGTSVNQSEACILPPQAFADDAVIEVTWDGKTLTVPLKGGVLRSGMVYTYEITVDHVGIGYSFNPTVSAWGSSAQREIDVTE